MRYRALRCFCAKEASVGHVISSLQTELSQSRFGWEILRISSEYHPRKYQADAVMLFRGLVYDTAVEHRLSLLVPS
jgi:hypothetical protein